MIRKGLILWRGGCGYDSRATNRRCGWIGKDLVDPVVFYLFRSNERGLLVADQLALLVVRLVLQRLGIVDVHKGKTTHGFVYRIIPRYFESASSRAGSAAATGLLWLLSVATSFPMRFLARKGYESVYHILVDVVEFELQDDLRGDHLHRRASSS